MRNEAQIGADFIPGVGEALGVEDTKLEYDKGNYGMAALTAAATGIGAIPVVGDVIGKGIKNVGRKLKWDVPDHGFLGDLDSIEGDYVTLYHGTNDKNVDAILENGLDKVDDRTGYVSLAPDPNTANGYAAMSGVGGESQFRRAGRKAVNAPQEERSVIMMRVPKWWLKENSDPNLRGNIGIGKDKLTDKAKYEQWKKENPGQPDSNYYMTTEFRTKPIPKEFIVGYMKKGEGGNVYDQTEEAFGITAHHASPHSFDKFKWGDEVRGKGEGAQAYGDGLYFAENPKTKDDYYRNFESQMRDRNLAKFNGKEFPVPVLYDEVTEMQKNGDLGPRMKEYRNIQKEIERIDFEMWEPDGFIIDNGGVLEEVKPDIDKLRQMRIELGKKLREEYPVERSLNAIIEDFTYNLTIHDLDYNRPVDEFVGMLESGDSTPERDEAIRQFKELFKDFSIDMQKAKKPSQYEVKIKAKEEDLLHLNKPFSEQSPKVQEAFKNVARKFRNENKHGYNSLRLGGILGGMAGGGAQHLTGKQLYDYLAKGGGGPEAASKALKEEGVPGSRFLDGFSRRRGEGSHNLVIWDPDVVVIVKKYGIAALVSAGLLSKEVGDQMRDQGLDKEQKT